MNRWRLAVLGQGLDVKTFSFGCGVFSGLSSQGSGENDPFKQNVPVQPEANPGIPRCPAVRDRPEPRADLSSPIPFYLEPQTLDASAHFSVAIPKL